MLSLTEKQILVGYLIETSTNNSIFTKKASFNVETHSYPTESIQ